MNCVVFHFMLQFAVIKHSITAQFECVTIINKFTVISSIFTGVAKLGCNIVFVI